MIRSKKNSINSLLQELLPFDRDSVWQLGSIKQAQRSSSFVECSNISCVHSEVGNKEFLGESGKSGVAAVTGGSERALANRISQGNPTSCQVVVSSEIMVSKSCYVGSGRQESCISDRNVSDCFLCDVNPCLLFNDLREEPTDDYINQIKNELENINESGICVIGNIIDLSSNLFESSISYIPISVNKNRRCEMYENKSEVLTFESLSHKERVLRELPIDYTDSVMRKRL